MPKQEISLDEILKQDPTFKSDKTGKEGFDLNVIVRQVIASIMQDRGWSQNKASKQLGIPQRSLGRFLGGDGWKLSTLSDVCAALETNPLRFLDSHDAIGRGSRTQLRAVRDGAYDRFRSILHPDEQDNLLDLVEQLKKLGIYETTLETLSAAVESGKQARKQAFREIAAKKRKKPSAS